MPQKRLVSPSYQTTFCRARLINCRLQETTNIDKKKCSLCLCLSTVGWVRTYRRSSNGLSTVLDPLESAKVHRLTEIRSSLRRRFVPDTHKKIRFRNGKDNVKGTIQEKSGRLEIGRGRARSQVTGHLSQEGRRRHTKGIIAYAP